VAFLLSSFREAGGPAFVVVLAFAFLVVIPEGDLLLSLLLLSPLLLLLPFPLLLGFFVGL